MSAAAAAREETRGSLWKSSQVKGGDHACRRERTELWIQIGTRWRRRRSSSSKLTMFKRYGDNSRKMMHVTSSSCCCCWCGIQPHVPSRMQQGARWGESCIAQRRKRKAPFHCCYDDAPGQQQRSFSSAAAADNKTIDGHPCVTQSRDSSLDG